MDKNDIQVLDLKGAFDMGKPLGNLRVDELLTSEKDAKWPSLKELKETNLFQNLK